MKEITMEQAMDVNGGLLAALVALITIITLPKIIHDNTKEYNEWGHDLSQQYWDHMYPYNPNSTECYGPHC